MKITLSEPDKLELTLEGNCEICSSIVQGVFNQLGVNNWKNVTAMKDLQPMPIELKEKLRVSPKNVVVNDNAWSKEEEEILIENYSTKPMDELKKLLPKRTDKAIYSRAVELKIKKKAYHRGARWSEEENKLVKKYYPIMMAEDIVEGNLIPGRTKNAISRQAFVLGLKKYKNKQSKKKKKEEQMSPEKSKITVVSVDDDGWSFEEENFLRDNFFTMGLETIIHDDMLKNKSEEQIRAKAKHLGMMLS